MLNFLFLFIIFSGQNDTCKNKEILGTWSYTNTIDNVINYTKTDKLNSSSSYIFEKKGKLTIRSIIRDGICGTPPHNYRSIPATWKMKGSVLTIEYEYTPDPNERIAVKLDTTKNKVEPKPVNNTISRKYKVIKLDDTDMQLNLI